MTAQLAAEVGSAVAWLACRSHAAGIPERIPIAALPFTVGRSDTTDLRIPSSWVSREHVVIEDDGGEFRARDLGSTNGTFVNGVAIQEASLHAGDILRIGNIDFVFSPDDAVANRSHVTELLDRPSRELKGLTVSDFVSRLRRTQELFLHQASHLRWRSIVDLQTRQVQAQHFAVNPADIDFPPAQWQCLPFEASCHHIGRLRLMARAAAIEQIGQQPGTEQLFLRIDASEIDQWDMLAHHLAFLHSIEPRPAKLVVELPANRTYESSWAGQIRDLAEELGAELAIGAFTGLSAQLRQHADLRPAFVSIRKSMLHVTTESAEKRLLSVLGLCAEMGAQCIVDGSGDERECARWKGWGIAMQLDDSELGRSVRRTTCAQGN